MGPIWPMSLARTPPLVPVGYIQEARKSLTGMLTGPRICPPRASAFVALFAGAVNQIRFISILRFSNSDFDRAGRSKFPPQAPILHRIALELSDSLQQLRTDSAFQFRKMEPIIGVTRHSRLLQPAYGPRPSRPTS